MSTIVSMKRNQVDVTAPVRVRAPDSAAVAQVLASFATDLGRLIDYDSFEYHNPHREVCLVLGDAGRHQCSYSLRQDELFLGDILLTRQQPFRESELQQLEHCLGALMPLLREAVRGS